MSVDVPAITAAMIDAVRKSLAGRWPSVHAVVEVELRKLAQTLLDVRRLHANGLVTTERAQELVRMQQNAFLTVLRTAKGLGLLTARSAAEAAAGAAGVLVNGLVGFKLITRLEPVTPAKEEPGSGSIAPKPAPSTPAKGGKQRPVRPGPSPKRSAPVKAEFKAGRDL